MFPDFTHVALNSRKRAELIKRGFLNVFGAVTALTLHDKFQHEETKYVFVDCNDAKKFLEAKFNSLWKKDEVNDFLDPILNMIHCFSSSFFFVFFS